MAEAPGAADRRRYAAAQEVCAHFKKLLDAFKLYEPGHGALAGFQQGLFAKLTDYLEQFGALELGVATFSLTLDGKPVLEAHAREDSIAQPLFVDGVQRIRVDPGATAEELDRFMRLWEASFSDSAACDSSFVTRFWESGFRHLAVVQVDAFSDVARDAGEAAGSDAEREHEKEKDRIQQAMEAIASGALLPAPRAARDSPEQLALVCADGLDDAAAEEVARRDAAAASGVPAPSAAELEALSAELAATPRVDLRRAVRALATAALAGTAEDLERAARLAHDVFRLLAKGKALAEVAAISAALLEFPGKDRLEAARRAEVASRLLAGLGGEELLDLCVEALSDVELRPHALAVIARAPEGSAGRLLAAWAGLADPQARAALGQAVSAKRLSPADLAAAVPKVDGARGLELVAMAVALGPKHADAVHRAALASKDSAVRRVALEALPREEVAQLRELLEPIVLDDAADLRRTAGDLLLSVRHEGLVPLLAQLLNRPDVDEAERKWAYLALGRLGGPMAAMKLLEEFDATTRSLELRCACALALGSCGDPSARPALEAAGRKLLAPRELKDACAEALRRLAAPRTTPTPAYLPRPTPAALPRPDAAQPQPQPQSPAQPPTRSSPSSSGMRIKKL